MWVRTYNQAKRVVIFVVGASVVLFGIILIVLPGPAFIVIPAGFAILATEFAWAKSFLARMKHESAKLFSGKKNSDSQQENNNL